MLPLDLPPYSIDDLSIHLVKLSSKYMNSMLEEVHFMTAIADPEHTIKDPKKSKDTEIELKNKY